MSLEDDLRAFRHPDTAKALVDQQRMASDREAKMADARKRAGKGLDDELRSIEPYVDPLPSFTRGAQMGAAIVAAFQLFAPGFFGTAEWPQWVRAFLGVVFLGVAAHLLIRQRGFMAAQLINRRTRP